MSPAAVPPVAPAAWGWSDVVVAVGVFLAIAGTLFPAIHRSRVNMRLMACQNNLRQFGLMQTHLDDAFSGTGVHPTVVNPWMAADMLVESSVRPREFEVGISASPRRRPSGRNPRPDAFEPFQRIQPVSNGTAIDGSAGAVCSMAHPGVREPIVGWNLLFPHGEVSFIVDPVVGFGAATSGRPGPYAAMLVPDNLNLTDNAAGLAPIVLVSHPER